MIQQAREVAMFWDSEPAPTRILLRDHDSKFVTEFDHVLRSHGVTIKQIGPLAPNLNAIAERWIQSIRQECLDHFVICGQSHLIQAYVDHYHTERPHQALDNDLLIAANLSDPKVGLDEPIIRRDQLGGLLKHYSRRAA
jgi:putative transposase